RQAPTSRGNDRLSQWGREEGAHGARGGDDAEAQAAPLRTDDPRGHIGGDAAGRARKGDADQRAAADEDHGRAAGCRSDRKTGRVEEGAADGDEARAKAVDQCAGERLVNPQMRFCTAIAMAKSAACSPRSCTTGVWKRPRLWRRPMAIDSMIAALDKTLMAWPRVRKSV